MSCGNRPFHVGSTASVVPRFCRSRLHFPLTRDTKILIRKNVLSGISLNSMASVCRCVHARPLACQSVGFRQELVRIIFGGDLCVGTASFAIVRSCFPSGMGGFPSKFFWGPVYLFVTVGHLLSFTIQWPMWCTMSLALSTTSDQITPLHHTSCHIWTTHHMHLLHCILSALWHTMRTGHHRVASQLIADVSYRPDPEIPSRLISDIVYAGLHLGPLKIPLPLRATGWLEFVYLDSELRVTRGNRGGLFVHIRPPFSPEVTLPNPHCPPDRNLLSPLCCGWGFVPGWRSSVLPITCDACAKRAMLLRPICCLQAFSEISLRS